MAKLVNVLTLGGLPGVADLEGSTPFAIPAATRGLTILTFDNARTKQSIEFHIINIHKLNSGRWVAEGSARSITGGRDAPRSRFRPYHAELHPHEAAVCLIAAGYGDQVPPEVARDLTSPPVELRGEGRPPVVLGVPKPPLTKAAYDVVWMMLQAGERGLRAADLEAKHGSARAIVRRLIESDPKGWGRVIVKTRGQQGRYRIARPD
jgi:hypothetical protein